MCIRDRLYTVFLKSTALPSMFDLSHIAVLKALGATIITLIIVPTAYLIIEEMKEKFNNKIKII